MWNMMPILFNFLAADAERKPIPWWLILLALALIVIILIWALNRNVKSSEEPGVGHEAADEPTRGAEGIELAEEAPAAPLTPDDLKIIEGIGPKIAGLLNQAGIITYAQLAAADVAELRTLLENAGLQHIADPATWPEQAALAARGDVTGLAALQESLKGGRRA